MLHSSTLEQALPFLQQYFLAPYGLLALLALIPLLLLYLMRPKPDERVMPSMAFFMEKKRSGTVQKALRMLQRNLVLLLNILFIAFLAAALAGPYLQGQGSADEAVIVVDRSASMADDMDAVEAFVRANAGSSNTLVVADESVEVPVEGASRRRVVSHVSGMEARDVETDIRSGLDVARGYDGKIAVASDLDQTVGGGDAVETVENLEAAGREVAVMETSQGNRWGIVGVEPSRGNSSLDVKNFMEREASVRLQTGDSSRTLNIPPGSVETVTVSTPEGTTSVRLEDDPVPADNAAYVSIPEEGGFRVLLITDEDNPYLERAVELINFTSVRTATPPLNTVPPADVYVIGESRSILRGTVGEIEDRVKDGASVVVFAQDGIFSKSSALPVERSGGREEVSVEIEEPRRVLVGPTEVFDVRVTDGESLATDNALVRSSHGNGEVVFYNLRDEDFRFDFLYPVFWKDLLEELTGRPTVEERNLETGEEIRFSGVTLPGGGEAEGQVMLSEAGFYETSQGVYAANLASPDESEEEEFGEDTGALTGDSETDKPLEPFAVALLLALAVGEFAYLRWRGSV